MGPAHGSCAWVLRRALSAGADIPVLGGGAESALAGELLERLIREAVSRPFVLGYRSEAAVEADRGLVPVKHGPFEPCTASLERAPREPRQQPLTDTETASVRPNEEILEKNPWLTYERGERPKEEGVAHWCAVEACEDYFCAGLGPEEGRGEVLGCGGHLVLQVLIYGELANELEHQRHLVCRRQADRDAIGHKTVIGHKTTAQPVPCKAWEMPPMLASSASKSSRSCRPPARQRCSRSTCIKFIGST